MISKTVRRTRGAVHSACFLGASIAALLALPGQAHAQAFNGVPATQDGSVTYNRSNPLGPGTETITINAGGPIIIPPHTVILWNVGSAGFLASGNTARYQGAPGHNFSVLNRLLFAGPGQINLDGIIRSQVSATNTVTAGRVGFEAASTAGLAFGSTAAITVGELWLRSADTDLLSVIWNGTLTTSAAGPTAAFSIFSAGPNTGLRLQYIDFTANSGAIGGDANTWLILDNSTFRLDATTLTLPSIFMDTSTFSYEPEGANTSRTLGQNFVFAGASNTISVDNTQSLTLSGTFANQASTSTLLKDGFGLLTLTGNSATWDASIDVAQGQLRVNGSLAAATIRLSNLTTLSGSGTVGNVETIGGGALSPGDGVTGIGTLTIAGDLSMDANAIYNAQVTPGGADRLVVQGLATLAGTLRIIPTIGNYGFDHTFTLVSAPGTAGNFFDTITGDNFGPNYVTILTQNINGVTLRLIAQDFLADLSPSAGTGNQRGTLGMIDDAVDDGDAPASLAALIGLSDADLLSAADALSGEAYATATRVALDDERLVREAALGRLQDAKGQGTAMWGQVFGSWGKGQDDGNAAAYSRSITGFAAGIDTAFDGLGGDLRLGVLLHHGKSDIDINDRTSEAEIERTGIGLYGAVTAGGFRFSLGGTYSALDLEIDRSVVFPGFNESLNGNTDGTALQGFAEIAYRFDLRNGALEPFVQASITSLDFDAFSETGGDAALTVADQSNEITSVIAGLRVAGDFGGLHLSGMVGYRSLSGDTSVATLVALGASPDNQNLIAAAALDKSAVVASFDAGYALSETASLSLGYSGVFADSGDDHAAKATFSLKF